MLKKILLSFGVLLVLLIGSLIAIPYFFQDEIKAKIAETINENLDAKVSFADADLSLFKSFPQANVAIEKLVIINKAPFEGDTLVSLGELNLKMSIKELFKDKDEPINIEALSTKNSVVNIIFNKDGIGNFDIALKDKKDEKDAGKSDPLNLKINQYEVSNMRFTYFDESSKIKMVLGDGEKIPYDDDYFDVITVAYGVRNFENLEKGLSEILRVLKPNGNFIILETSVPTKFPFKQGYYIYTNFIMPTIGKLFSKDKVAYKYLSNSAQNFPFGEALNNILRKIGFIDVKDIPQTMGVATIYKASKK